MSVPKGFHHTEESKRKMSKSHRGHIPWNKGRTGVFSKETLQKISEANKGQIPWNKGKTGIFSEEALRKIGKASKGNRHGLGYCHTKETRRKMSKARKGNQRALGCRHTEEMNKKKSKITRCRWQDPEYVRRLQIAMHTKPNRAERKLDAVLQEVCPGEFALNVRAEIMVLGGKIPDFVNVNHKKQLIEFWGDYWHREQNPQERIDYFKQFGDWDTLIIWEHELKDETKLRQKLLAFAGK